MKRCYHQWLKLAVTNDGGYGWCQRCGTIGGYGRITEATHVPEFYREMWPLSEAESNFLVAGRETEAINEYRLRTGFGLKEAKIALERYRSESVQSTAKKEASSS